MLEQSAPSQQSVLNIASWLVEAFTSHLAGRLDDAERFYRRILAVAPDHADSLHLLGVIFYQRGEYAQALDQIDLALEINPDNSLVWNQRGLTLQRLQRFDEALASYDRALAVQPDYAEALANRGDLLMKLKRFDEALLSYDRALAVAPDHAERLGNRAAALYELKRPTEALAGYDRALALGLDSGDLHYNRGNALLALKRFDEALASFERALARVPDHAWAYCNRGSALHALMRFEEALASHDRALALQPDHAIAHCNRGVELFHLKRFDDAAASYARALALQPDLPDTHYNEAHCRLLTGDLALGWEKFEWRWQIEPLKSDKRDFAQPQWSGSQEIAGKTVLLHASDGGFGDTIQFARYAPHVAARGARAILEVPRPLQELMRTLAGVREVVARGGRLPEFDLHCPLLSLPLAFGTRLTTIPAQTPYLRADAAAAETWNARLGPRNRPRIGIAWSGNPIHNNDRNRSIALRALLPLLADVDATFISLHREVRPADAAVLAERRDIVHFGEQLADYADTAALIANLDLVISVDTSVAHLAGALGKPVWLLLPFMPDWRWLLDREDSPWYPTARLFRQDDTRAWDGVIARVRAALQGHVRGL